ncbi:MAG: aminomethyl-transferring glycine dehydrogenase subunit GcvPA [Candidatus Dormibacteria bacterium]
MTLQHRYLPLSGEDRAAMLEVVGAGSQEALFASLPADLDHRLELPGGMSEQELTEYFSKLARENQDLTRLESFLGAGAYRRFIPSAVSQVISRPEFYTAYTPYQAEASQGWLQTIFEFQSMIAELTAMDVANASMYEAATAMAEAAVMAVVHTGRQRVVVAGTIHPEYLAVLRTYGAGRGFEVAATPMTSGGTADIEALAAALDDSAAVIFQQPNFFGGLEDGPALTALAHQHGALAIVSADPVSLAVLAPPGEYGADIAVGECQQLGIPLWYGGPYCGYLAASGELLRKIPGRLAGETVDGDGQRGFVLTLQAREQHIRRESATSNICTNQALIALGATAYLSVMGEKGLRRVAEVSAARAHHLAAMIAAKPGYSMAFESPFLWEFAVRCEKPTHQVLGVLRDQGILGGVDLGRFDRDLTDCILVAVTEMNSPESLDAFVEALP